MMNGNLYFKKAIETWGNESQIELMIEEMSELTQAIQKNKRGKDNLDNIHEEIADVSLMIEQMNMIFDKSEINKWKELKIERLKKRLNL